MPGIAIEFEEIDQQIAEYVAENVNVHCFIYQNIDGEYIAEMDNGDLVRAWKPKLLVRKIGNWQARQITREA